MDNSQTKSFELNRRNFLAAAGAASLAALGSKAQAAPLELEASYHQSICYWCFEKHWTKEQACEIAIQLGCRSIELVPVEDWALLKKHKLTCALAGSHWFDKGMNNPEYHEMCIDKMRAAIDACAEHKFPNVITFTGFRENISDEDGIKNCVMGYKKIVGYAEKKGVNLCLEMLNSRVAEEMKGHPGYQGDHTEYCMEIINQVGSERLTLLFDVYHVQIMDGDVITRLKKYKDHIGHYHTAGNPGRKELDESQEINYKAVMKEIAKTGYKGYVGQEFIPTRDPMVGLREAVQLCDQTA